MKKQTAALILFLTSLAIVTAARAQTPEQAGTSSSTDEQNIRAYIDLLHADVRQQKAEMMGAVMLLSGSDAKKFWPIYNEYDAELAKLNDLRATNIQEYAHACSQLTDEKADDLMQKALSYDQQQSELLTKYYGRVKEELGAVTAARFVQVEHQLLFILDLRIASALPIVGS